MSLKLGGESAIVYNNVALLYISAGRFEDATALLVHALKLDSQRGVRFLIVECLLYAINITHFIEAVISASLAGNASYIPSRK